MNIGLFHRALSLCDRPTSRAWTPTGRCAPKPNRISQDSGPDWRARISQWSKPFTQVLDESGAPFYKWFHDGELNASYNCLDRNLANGNAEKVAIIFEADDGKVTKITYRELHAKVCQLANGLKALGYAKGERAIIYMPMSIEAVVAMQACARLGITHSVVFGGFSAKSVQERVIDAGATLIVAADEQLRGGKAIALKSAIDDAFAIGGCDNVRNVIVYRRTGGKVAWNEGRDIWLHDVMAQQPSTCDPVPVNCRASAFHPLHVRFNRPTRRACSTRLVATCCGRP